MFGLTRQTVEALVKKAQERIYNNYRFYASLVGAELEGPPKPSTRQDPKSLLQAIQQSGIAYVVENSGRRKS